jgi:muramoyltetrapeptide carboxypeptidase
MGKDLFCANTDEERLKHLSAALRAKDSRALWAIRGGYGAARLMPALRKMKAPPKEKLVIGFSDITVLHLFFAQEWGWHPLHGPVLTPITRAVVSVESLKRLKAIIFGKTVKTELKELKPLNKAALRPGTVKGRLTGGNLSLVEDSIGTPWQAKTKGRIVLLEEVDERPYRVDRLINHLWQAGILKQAQAIIFGSFGNEVTDKETLKYIDKALKRFAEEHPSIPMLKTDKIGHALDNYPMPLNTDASLKLGAKPLLTAPTGVKRT